MPDQANWSRSPTPIAGSVITIGWTMHGRPTDEPGDGPLVISSRPELLPDGPVHATSFKQLVLDHVFS